MNNATQATQNIINNIQISLLGAQNPSIMMDNILTKAQTLVNEEGFVWDVALKMACGMYPRTQFCGLYAYEA